MIQRPLGTCSIALLAAASMAACMPALSRNGTSDALPPEFDARTVELRSIWRGGVGYRRAWVARLERQADTHTFTGTVEMSVSGPEGHKRAGPIPITVPDSAMRSFLAALAAAPRRGGSYRTLYTHTDDYPNFTMTLCSDAGVVEFFSDSQSERNWRVTLGGERYVSDSPVPFLAQDFLEPFYRQEEIDRILDATTPVSEYGSPEERRVSPCRPVPRAEPDAGRAPGS
jgi:hypothetical protein